VAGKAKRQGIKMRERKGVEEKGEQGYKAYL